MINTYAACKALAKHEIPAVYVNRDIFRIGDRELRVTDDMVYTDVCRWRYNTFRDFFYNLKSEKLFYLSREQMADVCSYYYILTERPKEKEQKREVEKNDFRIFNSKV